MNSGPPKKSTMGRPRVFDEADVLDRIMQLFWKHGYHAASIGDLSDTTGVGRQSLYKVFEDKRGMYLRALERYEDKAVKAAVTALRGDDPPQDRIRAFLSVPITALHTDQGCFLCNASADQAAHDDQIRATVRRGFSMMADALADALAQQNGLGKPTEAEKAHAWSLLSIYGGLQIMSRSGMDRTHLENILEDALRL